MYAAKADELPDGRWIWTTQGGWSLPQLDDPTLFTFAELSAAAPANPLWIQGGGFTGARVNQAALTALGLAAGLARRRARRERQPDRPARRAGDDRGEPGDPRAARRDRRSTARRSA